jgi:hypothetical protein
MILRQYAAHGSPDEFLAIESRHDDAGQHAR